MPPTQEMSTPEVAVKPPPEWITTLVHQEERALNSRISQVLYTKQDLTDLAIEVDRTLGGRKDLGRLVGAALPNLAAIKEEVLKEKPDKKILKPLAQAWVAWVDTIPPVGATIEEHKQKQEAFKQQDMEFREVFYLYNKEDDEMKAKWKAEGSVGDVPNVNETAIGKKYWALKDPYFIEDAKIEWVAMKIAIWRRAITHITVQQLGWPQDTADRLIPPTRWRD